MDKNERPNDLEIEQPRDVATEDGAVAAPSPKGENNENDEPSGAILTCPIVGIGASAGGLAALESLFSAMPTDTPVGMAFVVIQHLDPHHPSLLFELLGRYTRMPVREAVDGVAVEPNAVYVIPPGWDMACQCGRLRLLPPSAPRGFRLPIDFFFRSLAQDQQARAIGIVLSGTGSDGTAGLRAIKGEGGMAMAQRPDTADHDGMPRSAVDSGLMDFVLAPEAMPAQLLAYVASAFGRSAQDLPGRLDLTDVILDKVFVLLRTQTGHDFSGYKRSTIGRRIERRLAVHRIVSVDEYLRFLQTNPAESQALLDDLLINVTNFFRDPEAFVALRELVLTPLLTSRSNGAPIRIWVPGCATGEEAYTIAICLQEEMERLQRNNPVQIFATDIDRHAVELARAGLYSASVAVDLTAERLARFFRREASGHLRVHKTIRDMLVFSEQSLVKDPPFSRLDLISCRNLLIYLRASTQARIMTIAHYALAPGGALLLGSSETTGESAALFSCVDPKWKIYLRREVADGAHLPSLGSVFVPLLGRAGKVPGNMTAAVARKPSWRELTETAMLLAHGSVGVLVDERGDVLYIHGRTGRYLEPAQGDFALNVVKMAREGLLPALTTALHRAATLRLPVCEPRLRVRTNGDFTTVRLTVCCVDAPGDAARLFLVMFDEVPEAPCVAPPAPSVTLPSNQAGTVRVADLEFALRARDGELLTAREDLEASNEELRAANEEMQSVNEELQSTNEELETSKEELQSVNEELATVNAELQGKVSELSRSNNDMNNLLAGTGVGTLFVDHQLRIRRFTPTAVRTIHLIPTDVGRPLAHVVGNLSAYDHLVEDVQRVLETLVPEDIVIQAKDGPWFLMRIRPYRTLENVIEGAVITFVDITEIERARVMGRAGHFAFVTTPTTGGQTP